MWARPGFVTAPTAHVDKIPGGFAGAQGSSFRIVAATEARRLLIVRKSCLRSREQLTTLLPWHSSLFPPRFGRFWLVGCHRTGKIMLRSVDDRRSRVLSISN